MVRHLFYQFGILELDFKTALKRVSYQIDSTIYSMFILYPFQRILNFVYGIEYILLPNEICAATSAMLLGFSCKRFGGNKTGYFAVILAAFSQAYIINAAYQYRIYAFLLLVSTFILLFYLKRNFQIMKENLYDKKTLIVFGIALFLLVEEHGVTILLPLFLFLFDVYLCYRKKLQVKVLFSYILAGVLYLPKLIYILATNGWPTDDWRPASNIMSFLNIFFDYMIRIDIVKVIFIAGVFLAAILFSKSKIKNCNWRIVSLCGAITAIFGAFLTAFVYSGAINPKGSFFVDRYFLFLLPWMFFVCAFVFNAFLTALSKNRQIISSVFCLVFASYFAVTVYPGIYFAMKGNQEWFVSRYNLNRINYLFAQDDIYDKDVGVIISYATAIGEFNGIKAFYISKYGRQDVFQIISAQDLERETFNKVFLIPLLSPNFHETLQDIEKIKSLGFKETARLDNLGIMVYEKR
ncbi:MAG: hypothetical protein LBH29_02300 [Elusimicrobiota bacterium]|nr:hypothetical protein [Elusimicrobiota bacterium]